MDCKICGRKNPDDAEFCGQCGRKLASPASKVSDELDQLQKDLDSELGSLSGELDRDLGSATPAKKEVPKKGAKKSFAAAGAKALVHQEEINALVMPLAEEINQARSMVFDCRFIENYPQYKDRVRQVTFRFLKADSTVNAFATDQPVKLSNGKTVPPPGIYYLGGLANACCLGSAALAAHVRCWHDAAPSSDESPLLPTFQKIGQTIVGSGGRFELDTSTDIFNQSVAPVMRQLLQQGEERFVSLAQSYRVSMYMSVVAHELGHIALGHTLGREVNFNISRNQEREADSFASSALSTCPYREYHFLGSIFQNIIFAWVHHAGGSQAARTHPLSRERFENAFRDNSEAAKEAAEDFGLTHDMLSRLLPPE